MSRIKTILVGIDYTKSSDNALQYAILLAEKSTASLMLFHVYENPIVHLYSGAYFVDYDNVEKGNIEKLEKYKAKILSTNSKLDIAILATDKSIKSSIKDLVEKHKISLVVFGLESKSKVSKFLYGTTGVKLASRIKCPVIIVPEDYKQHQLKHTVLAVDNNEHIKSKIVKKAKEFNNDLNLPYEFIHVKTEYEFLALPTTKIKKEQEKLKVKVIESENFVSGIKSYTSKNKVDLIIVISHSHSALYNLFNDSNTKLIAFESKKPVMCFHA
jgi:nucleotide-binding universal stress UspA family protein